MATNSTVLEDNSARSRADRWLFAIESSLTLLCGLFILAIMVLSVVNIIGRKFFNFPVPGFIDWMVQAVPIIAFLGIGYCQRLGNHIRMDMVVSKLKRRVLWLFELVSVIIMGVIALMLVYGSWNHAARAFNLGDSTIDINLPTWPVKVLVPVMFMMLFARLVLQGWAYWHALANNTDQPVAVPLIENAAEQANREAQSVSGLSE